MAYRYQKFDSFHAACDWLAAHGYQQHWPPEPEDGEFVTGTAYWCFGKDPRGRMECAAFPLERVDGKMIGVVRWEDSSE